MPTLVAQSRFSVHRLRSCRRALLVIALLSSFAPILHAQSPLDGFDPNANGAVRVVAVQPDGKILIGGEFTSVLGTVRNGIARLNADGTLDTAFNPNCDGIVLALAVQPDSQIVAGGNFRNVGGQPRKNLARLDATTGAVDPSFNPNANFAVVALAMQSDGKIVVGGAFNGANSIGGQARNGVARLDPTTGLADSFNPNVNGTVFAIALQADGKILVGGDFSGANSVGGQTRNRIARLDAATGLVDPFNPNANGVVFSIAVQPDGKILAGGGFSGVNGIGGQSRTGIARLDPTTGLADSFDGNTVNGGVISLAVQADGKIIAGGTFTGIGGQTRNNLARLDGITGLADTFNPNANTDTTWHASISSVAIQSDGKVLTGGYFTALAPNGGPTVTRNHIARLEADGRLDQTLDIRAVSGMGRAVHATAVQPDGKIIIGGDFTTVLGVTRNLIARLNTDGTLDTAFDPNASGSQQFPAVLAIAVQPDGKILVAGVFNNIGGQPRNRIARLDPATGLADSFDPNANDVVCSIMVQTDGKILVGGAFNGLNSIGGQTRNRIARLDPATGLADSFDPNASAPVYAITMQPDGKILAGGYFTSIGGQPRNRIARLDAVTGLADSFNPNANAEVYAVALQTDGKILVGGRFNGENSIGGQTRNNIARLDPITGTGDSFDPNANATVYSIASQADGRIFVGGDFWIVGGQTRNLIARLDPTTGLADSFDPQVFPFAEVFSIALQKDGKVLIGGNFERVGGAAGPIRNLFARLSNDTSAGQELAVTQTAINWTRSGASAQLRRVTFDYSADNVNYFPLGGGVAAGSGWTLDGLNLSTGQTFYVRGRGSYHTGGVNGSESITESVRSVFLSEAMQLVSVSSRKTHGAAGEFDIPLPLKGEPGVECRSTGGAHTLIFTFSSNVVSGNASVTGGAGNITGNPTFTGNTMITNLAGVIDAQKVTIALSGVTDSSGQLLSNTTVSMNVLAGDLNGNKAVSAADISEVKARAGSPVDASNFRADVAVSGTINTSDIALVKSRAGQTVP